MYPTKLLYCVVKKKEDLLLIKYFDRLHNLQTLQIKSPNKQSQIVSETLKEFLPIAAHFGMFSSEKWMSKICASINLNLQGLNPQRNSVFSFLDNYQLLSLAFQNA